MFLPPLLLAAYLELGNYTHYDPIRRINTITVPILLFSAKHDESLYSTDAKDLYNKANQPKEYWQADTPHDIFKYNPEVFKGKVLTFLQKYAGIVDALD